MRYASLHTGITTCQCKQNYNQTGNIATLDGASLKLVDKFNLGSSVSSTEKDIAWTAIDRLSIIWKSDLTDKMKRTSRQRLCRYCYMDAPHGRLRREEVLASIKKGMSILEP